MTSHDVLRSASAKGITALVLACASMNGLQAEEKHQHVSGDAIDGKAADGGAEALVQWDEEAAKEVMHALHKMHDVWNEGDIKGLKKLLVGDDVLITFELDAATHEPIRITSRKELYDFVDNVSDDADANNGVFRLDHPQLRCRATKNFAICTEECSVTVKLPGGIEEKYNLWSTATAVRYQDGWKWIQWHMSTAGPCRVYKEGKLVWQGHKDDRPDLNEI